MKITALVENTTNQGWRTVHGLSLYIETPGHKILFDVGPDDTLFANAERAGVDLTAVDTAIISHGHSDHGGALAAFLDINHRAKVYIQRSAFDMHYIKILGIIKFSGSLDRSVKDHPQVVLLDGDCRIDEELLLFTTPDISRFPSPANSAMYDDNGPDTFGHEHNLIIFGEKKNTLIMGCGHAGVVNILDRAAEYSPKLCVGGYHLFNPTTLQSAPETLLHGIAGELNKKEMTFYTCHCTGKKVFSYLTKNVRNMRYLACGDCIEA